MDRLPRLALALLCGTGLAVSLTACGDDGGGPASPTPPPASSAATIEFVGGFPAAAAKASDPDALVFVYVGRHNPT